MMGSTPTPIPHAVRTPGEYAEARVQLVRALAAFRRRRREVLGLRFLWTCLAVSIVLGEGLSLALHLGALPSAWLIAGAVAAAVVASLIASAVRAPSIAETARLVDRRAPLQNRAATALQYIEDDDAMARLVLSDATRRIAALDPALVFPREAPARPQLLVATVTLSTLVFGAVVFRADRAPRPEPPGATGTASAGATHSGEVTPGAPTGAPPAAVPAGENPATVIPKGAEAQSTEPAATAQAARDEPTARTETRTASPGAVAGETPQGAVTGSPTRPVPSSDVSTAAGRAATGAAGARSPAGDARLGAGTRGAAGEGAGAPGSSDRGGGGVKGGALEGQGVPAARAGRSADQSPASAVEYQAAWARAQAALAQGRVPPPLREYVRRYFTAIRSPRRP